MSRLLWRASRRHLARHPWQIGLAILGIALGVAVALSIDLATQSARRAFELATEAVTGRATHQIVGGPAGLAEDVYRILRLRLGVRHAAPVLAVDVAAPDHPGQTFHLFGVDPFAEQPFRPYLADPDRSGTGQEAGRQPAFAILSELVARPSTGLISGATGRRLGLAPGDTLTIRIAGERKPVTLIGWIEPADALSGRAFESLLVTDIATAQELTGARGRLSRIDLIIPGDAAGRALLERIRDTLPAGADVVPAGARAERAASMTAAFTLNLSALSLLALFVGMFLIYNTMTFFTVQRRRLLGLLRALGVTRGEVFTLVMVEALVVGAVGTAAGLALGLWLARGLLGLVTRTINDLYFVLSLREVSISWEALARSVLLGLGATLAAALAPAAEATGARPREALSRSGLEARARRMAPRAAAAGVLLLVVGAAALLPRAGAGWGFVGLFGLVMGAALATPLSAVLVLRGLQAPAGRMFGLLGRVAVRGVVAALSRTGVAITALMIAVSASIGISIMITSFRAAVVSWLDATLRADIYVSPPSLIGNRPGATLDPALLHRLATTPGVAGASTSRAGVALGPGGSVQIVALGLDGRRAPGFTLREGRPDTVWPAIDAGAVIVSEPFAYRHAVGAGGSLRLRTDRGVRDFPVAGVFYDYGSSAGVVVMSRATYHRFWDDRAVSGLALYAAPGPDVERLMTAVRERAAGGPEVTIRSNRALRDASLQIFDRTFAITAVLRLLSIVVAFVGVLSALMALQLERERENAVLRALGLTPGQVWRLVTAQTGVMGLVAGLLAVPVGVMLAAVLVFVINRRSFGCTMPIDVAPVILLEGVLLAVTAALLAGLYPGWKMAAASAAEALREE